MDKLNFNKLSLCEECKPLTEKGTGNLFRSDKTPFGGKDDFYNRVYIYNKAGIFTLLGGAEDLLSAGILVEKQPEYFWINDYPTDVCAHRTIEKARDSLMKGGVTKKVMVVDE